MAVTMKRPTIAVSRCLLQPESESADSVWARLFLLTLGRCAKLVPVCPENEIKPRPKAATLRLVKTGKQLRLYEAATGRDLTRPGRKAVADIISGLDGIDGVVLRKGSRFCGPEGVDVYQSADPGARKVGSTAGLFAQALRRHLPDAFAIDSTTLLDHAAREQWLTAVYTSAEFRALHAAASLGRLRQFHERYRTLLEAFDPRRARRLDQMVQKTGVQPRATIAAYDKLLRATLALRPTAKQQSAPMIAAFEHLAPHLGASEKKRFDRAMREFERGRLPLAELRKLILVWAIRYDKRYVQAHAFFRPYPQELA